MENNELHQTKFGLLNEEQIRQKAKELVSKLTSNWEINCLVCNESNCSYNDKCKKCGVAIININPETK